MRALVCPALLAVIATPAAAQLRAVPDQPASASAARGGVDVYLINDTDTDLPGAAPARLEVTAADASRIALVPIARPPAVIAAHGFARVRYLSAGVVEVDRAALRRRVAGVPPVRTSPSGAAAPPVAAAPAAEDRLVATPAPLTPPAEAAPMMETPLPPSSAEPAPEPLPRAARIEALPARIAATPAPPPLPARQETVVEHGNGESRGFLDRFIPYEPIYGAIGLRSAATKLQVSFGLRPFGGTGALSHFTFAYTQTMFWATDRPSGPFRATTYSPEAFFDVPVADRLRLAVGYRHDSNGEGDPTSIDVNRLFVRAVRSFDLGRGWQVEVVPQAWVYVGREGYTADVKDYYGHFGLKASIGQPDGVKLSLSGRGSVDTGRGGLEAFLSYPLVRLGDAGFYIFGQGFTGYGEALDEYRRRETNLRLGIALTR